MRNYILILLILLYYNTSAQVSSNIKSLDIKLASDTTKLDSLSIIPNSVFIFDKSGKLISDKEYKIDYSNSLLILNNTKLSDIKVRYKTFPYNFSTELKYKSLSLINNDSIITKEKKTYTYNEKDYYRYYTENKLDKRGSISRGISFGNNQDVIVNSNLNLQLSGKLSDELNVLATISDNNIPIQPDGNSQQLQEFDKVFITVFNNKSRVTVGDFVLDYRNDYFLKVNKKLKGGIASSAFDLSKKKNNSLVLKSTVSGAVSKGNYCKQEFAGVEGNQGPYKLMGCNNEMHIIILSGSENVFIDGKKLSRGLDYDYTINYNTGEITFTPKQIITKDKRIVVEFEYTDQNYARFSVFNSNEIITKKSKTWLNIYSENDSKNQTLQQDLNNDEKKIMSVIGDDLDAALSPNIDSIGFTNDYVLYKKIDSLVNGIYQQIYVYSTSEDSAFYRLSFSQVGETNGNYIQTQTTANGRVFRWVAPINGIKQGAYEPVVLLITPKQKQVVSIGNESAIGRNTKTFFNLAFSNNDINTFSPQDDNNNIGYAIKIGASQDNLFKKDSTFNLSLGVNYELISGEFNPAERFRSVEFDRDWNTSVNSTKANEQIINSNIKFYKRNFGSGAYNFDLYSKERGFVANKNNINLKFHKKGFSAKILGSVMNSEDNINSTAFYRDKVEIAQKIKIIELGLRHESENNKWNLLSSDSLVGNSYSFNQYEIFLNNADTADNKIFANYKYRIDANPLQNILSNSLKGEDFSIGYNYQKSKKQTIKSTINYRKLTVLDTSLSTLKPDENVTGRVEHNARFYKSAITSSTFYEIGSGLEAKKEFAYIEVAPGQGVYNWTDYNDNNIKELNEFEIAIFQDQANYIRVFTPTNQYIKVYSNHLNQTFTIRPKKIWRKEKGVKKLASKFSNMFAYNVNHKLINSDLITNVNPFAGNINDSTMMSMSTSIRNIFSFNKNSSKIAIDYIYQENKNRLLLISGFDSRLNIYNGLNIRWNITKNFALYNKFKLGNKDYYSEFFSTKNYSISYFDSENDFSFQPNLSLRFTIKYKFIEKENNSGEKLQSNNAGLELRHNVLKKGNLLVGVNIINIKYPYNTNGSLAYEMLQGLMPGNNLTWTVMYQRNISKTLMLNLNYNARYSTGNDIVHTGGVQLRAYF